MEKSKNLVVVSASPNYLASINALFNSIDYHKIDTDVLLVSWRLPQEYIKKAQETFDFNIIVVESEHEHQVQGTAIERFRYAVEYGKDYEAVCLLDADIFFTDNPSRFFYAASKGVIITGHNGMHISFTKEHQRIYQCDLGVEEYPHYQIHTTAPIFLSPQDLDWFDSLYKSERVDSFDDFLYLNVLGIKMGKIEKMICMPPYFFTQIHHFGIKPNTRIIEKGGVLLSETEERICSVHGKWENFGWYDGLMMPMQGYFEDNDFSKKHEERALESREVVLNEFLRLCYKHKLNFKEFATIEWLENKMIEKGWDF